MYVPPTLCEAASAVHPILVALFSTCRLRNLSRTPRSGPRESPSPGAKESLAVRQVNAFGTILEEIPSRPPTSSFLRPSKASGPCEPQPQPIRTLRISRADTISRPHDWVLLRRYVCILSVNMRTSMILFASCCACHGTADPITIVGIGETAVLECTSIVSGHCAVSKCLRWKTRRDRLPQS
jgi:hypothetical protein